MWPEDLAFMGLKEHCSTCHRADHSFFFLFLVTGKMSTPCRLKRQQRCQTNLIRVKHRPHQDDKAISPQNVCVPTTSHKATDTSKPKTNTCMQKRYTCQVHQAHKQKMSSKKTCLPPTVVTNQVTRSPTSHSLCQNNMI